MTANPLVIIQGALVRRSVQLIAVNYFALQSFCLLSPRLGAIPSPRERNLGARLPLPTVRNMVGRASYQPHVIQGSSKCVLAS